MTSDSKLIYIGPNISGSRLQKFQVFCDGYPKHIPEVFQKLPQIKFLFVPIEEMNSSIEETKKMGTALNKYYKLAMEV